MVHSLFTEKAVGARVLGLHSEQDRLSLRVTCVFSPSRWQGHTGPSGSATRPLCELG